MSREPEYIEIRTTHEQRMRREAIPVPSNDVYDVAFIIPGNPKAQKVPTTYWSVRDSFLFIDNNAAHLPTYDIPEVILVQCR